MPTPKIKICGIATAPALEAAIRARADYVGLVFFPASPRHVSLTEAAALAERGGPRVARIGLFVDGDDATIADAVTAGRLDGLQLHGHETPERTGQVRARFGLPTWKAIPVASAQDVSRAQAYAPAADLILFDAKTPKGALPGGMGLTFDWDLIAGWKHGAWGLAGGLNPANVAEAVRRTGTPLVDTSSGVESAPGVKDEASIAAFCVATRAG